MEIFSTVVGNADLFIPLFVKIRPLGGWKYSDFQFMFSS